MSGLKIAENLTLPHEAVTQTFAILAKRGKGKTYTASVMTEEMLKSGLHVVVIDPIGVWYGLRSSADGKSEGLPIIIAGGEHADIPLTPESGEILARLIVENRLSIVIDISLFRKGEQTRFMTAFAETIYRLNRNALHLMVDEADAFAPQRPQKGQERMLGAMEDLVRRGRARGIGMTMITQRPAVLNKNVLTQIEVLVALGLTAPLDQKAIDEWVKSNAEAGQREEFMNAIASLPVGTAYFWSPGWLKVFEKVQIRKRETLDSSSTPVAGQEVIIPQKMASVNLEALTEQLSQAQENIELKDPKALKARVKQLEEELEIERKHPKTILKEIKVPTMTPQQMATLHKNIPPVIKVLQELYDVSAEAEAWPLGKPFKENSGPPIDPREYIEIRDLTEEPIKGLGKSFMELGSPPRKPNKTAVPLSKAARTILAVLAQFPSGRTKSQISILSGYSIKSSSFSNALSELRGYGFVTVEWPMRITQKGMDNVGDFEPLPRGMELLQWWADRLSRAEGLILDVVVAAHPQEVDYETISRLTSYSRTSSSFSNALSKLRSLQLIHGKGKVKADEIFWEK